MAFTKDISIQLYKDTLYPHLLMACIASECKEAELDSRPKEVIKDTPFLVNLQDRQQQTFIMRWNPEISNYKVVDFEHAMEDFRDDGFYYDWSIFDYRKVRVGDRFYMLKVGNGNTGIVMSGIIVSLPYKDEDWSGKGRDVRYVRMIPDCMVHPDNATIVSIQTLDKEMPGVNWNEGHSGVLLDGMQANKFDELWHKFAIKMWD